jgi:hypothetical protein
VRCKSPIVSSLLFSTGVLGFPSVLSNLSRFRAAFSHPCIYPLRDVSTVFHPTLSNPDVILLGAKRIVIAYITSYSLSRYEFCILTVGPRLYSLSPSLSTRIARETSTLDTLDVGLRMALAQSSILRSKLSLSLQVILSTLMLPTCFFAMCVLCGAKMTIQGYERKPGPGGGCYDLTSGVGPEKGKVLCVQL